MKGRISETKCIMYLSRLHYGMSTVKNKPVISFAKFVVSITSIISSKMEITFEVTTLGRSLFSGGRCFWHSLTPAKVLRYFRRVPSFARGGGGSLLSVLNCTRTSFYLGTSD